MEPPSPYLISISNASGRRAPRAILHKAALASLHRHQLPAGSVSILLTTSEHQAELNKTYRGIEADTDVLTFPAEPIPSAGIQSPLGDISISLPFAENQARQRGLRLSHELAHLVIHGVLHLAGFDDETESDRRAMQAAMAEMAENLEIPIDPEWESVLLAVVEAGR